MERSPIKSHHGGQSTCTGLSDPSEGPGKKDDPERQNGSRTGQRRERAEMHGKAIAKPNAIAVLSGCRTCRVP